MWISSFTLIGSVYYHSPPSNAINGHHFSSIISASYLLHHFSIISSWSNCYSSWSNCYSRNPTDLKHTQAPSVISLPFHEILTEQHKLFSYYFALSSNTHRTASTTGRALRQACVNHALKVQVGWCRWRPSIPTSNFKIPRDAHFAEICRK
jgi:hypothetical protein